MANLCGPQAEKHVEIHEEISKDGKTCEKKIFFSHVKTQGCLVCLVKALFQFQRTTRQYLPQHAKSKR